MSGAPYSAAFLAIVESALIARGQLPRQVANTIERPTQSVRAALLELVRQGRAIRDGDVIRGFLYRRVHINDELADSECAL